MAKLAGTVKTVVYEFYFRADTVFSTRVARAYLVVAHAVFFSEGVEFQ